MAVFLFQSTLPRGERRCFFLPRFSPGYRFQSTLPRGERLPGITISGSFLFISIHAPTRGATCQICCLFRFWMYFNPRSHEGSDVRNTVLPIVSSQFQSTLPRGERRERGGLNGVQKKISIHAPTRGATSAEPEAVLHRIYFNPRSHEGSDRAVDASADTGSDFNPRSHEGSDSRACCSFLQSGHFNPRSHEGSDTPDSVQSSI